MLVSGKKHRDVCLDVIIVGTNNTKRPFKILGLQDFHAPTITMTVWESLPKELQLLILDALSKDGCCMAPYATVSREWQTIIEQEIFSRLTLSSSRLKDFDQMTRQRRHLVKYKWLCVELQAYDRSQCEHVETDQWHKIIPISSSKSSGKLSRFLVPGNQMEKLCSM